MMKVAFLVLLGLVAINAKSVKVTDFKYDNCGANWPIMIESLSIQPDPIVVPGPVTLSVSITGTEPVVSPSPADFNVTYLNPDTGAWENIACFDDVIPLGSCHYDDACSILAFKFPPDQPCPQPWIDQNVPCNCPFEAGTVTLNNAEIQINSAVAALPDGTYNVNLNLYNSDGLHLGCTNIQGTLEHAA